jgi:vacuolar-type H+-ATPase subunit H
MLSDDASTQKRRSTRIVQAVPITVSGVDALGQPFKERTTTVMVNVHGCRYQSKHYVPKNSTLTLEIPRLEPSLPARTVLGRVVWVQRPRAVRELFQIGLEFEVAGNVWGIAFPPEDWFSYPGESSQVPASPEAAAPVAQVQVPVKPETKIETRAAAPAITPITPPAAPATPSGTATIEKKIHVVSGAMPTEDTQLTTARQMAKMVSEVKDTLDKTLRRGAQTAINEEMTFVRQQLDAQLHEAVEKAIKVSMERVSESAVKKVVQQAAERTAAIVEEARKANDTSVGHLDAKVRDAVQQAVSQAADQAAQQAAQQATAHNLKQAVEEAVERVVSQREASSPSIGVLASPEAAQQHLDDWKKNLEETAQRVRVQTIEQAQADAEAAKRRWNEEFELAVTGASQTLGEKLGGVSQNLLSQTETEIAAHKSNLRNSLDEAIAGAQATIQSMGAGLEQERARTEEARAQLEEAARSTLDKTEHRLDEILNRQQEEIARRADRVIVERTQHIEPLLQNSAQKAIDYFSSELNQQLGLKLDAAQKAASELAHAGEQSVQLRTTIREQMQQATEQAARIQAEVRAEVQQTAEQVTQKAASELARAGEQSAQLQTTIREQMQQAAEQAARIQASVRAEVQQTAEQVTQKAASELAHAGEQSVQLQTTIREQMQQATEQAARIQASVRAEVQQTAEQVTQIQAVARDQVQQASQQAVRESLEQLRQESAKVPAEFQQSYRAVLSKIEDEFEQKSTEAQHETFEALSKASDWYQKKAQTTMQSTLEKAVEQSTTSLRSRAAEISSLVASELDHYRRSYVEHSQAEIEEAAKEVVERERAKMGESAEVAHANFADRVQHVTGESLRRFDEASRQALEKARADMEYDREDSLTRFQKILDDKMTQGVEQAQTYLQSQLGPLAESFEASRQAQQRERLEQLKKSTDESIDQYKARLENASNSWLLASATTLGQHSQSVLDTLAKAAEKRMRESIAGVLAGMGDTLKDRLLGISTDFGAKDEDGDEPKPKKK